MGRVFSPHLVKLEKITMTILEAIHIIDGAKPNSCTPSEKIRWLSSLDGRIKREIIDTHEGGENIPFTGYQDNTDLNTTLLVPTPYDNIYVHFLEAQIDYANGEYKKYNNSTAAYNSAFSEYAKAYNRNNMPKATAKRFIF